MTALVKALLALSPRKGLDLLYFLRPMALPSGPSLEDYSASSITSLSYLPSDFR